MDNFLNWDIRKNSKKSTESTQERIERKHLGIEKHLKKTTDPIHYLRKNTSKENIDHPWYSKQSKDQR